jgi:hypothetical protein
MQDVLPYFVNKRSFPVLVTISTVAGLDCDNKIGYIYDNKDAFFPHHFSEWRSFPTFSTKTPRDGSKELLAFRITLF